jgi:RNA-directed DNA polymerase
MCDKALQSQVQRLADQAKRIARPVKGRKEYDEIRLFNTMVMGVQNYYCIATHINLDCDKLQYAVSRILHNRLRTQKETRLRKTGRPLTQAERERYGKSKQIRYVAGSQEPIYPIAYVQHKNPIAKRRNVCCYTPEGRQGLHDNLRINTPLMLVLMRQPLYHRSIEYADSRISLFSAQWGKCAVTGKDFMCVGEIHCHHKIPKAKAAQINTAIWC